LDVIGDNAALMTEPHVELDPRVVADEVKDVRRDSGLLSRIPRMALYLR
jgi:hypothetical protein